MALFALIPRTPAVGALLDSRVREKYGDNCTRLDLGVWIVSAPGTVRQIADSLNVISGEAPLSPLSVIVFGLTGSYTGRAITTVWDKLKELVERDSDA